MMRRFLICAGLDGRTEALSSLQQLIADRQPDGVLFAGDVSSPDRAFDTAARQEAEHLYGRFFQTLGHAGVFTAVIPGAGDAPLRSFLQPGMAAELEYPSVRLVHATLVQRHDHAFCGLGGELTEHEDNTEGPLRYARSSAEYFLRSLSAAEQTYRVLMLSVPPPGPLAGDRPNDLAGHLIESYHPQLCVVAGPTAHSGSQRIAHTTVINPGRLADGSAAWFDWSQPEAHRLELLPLSD